MCTLACSKPSWPRQESVMAAAASSGKTAFSALGRRYTWTRYIIIVSSHSNWPCISRCQPYHTVDAGGLSATVDQDQTGPRAVVAPVCLTATRVHRYPPRGVHVGQYRPTRHTDRPAHPARRNIRFQLTVRPGKFICHDLLRWSPTAKTAHKVCITGQVTG